MAKLYVAYGSNCNIGQMTKRCVDSILLGTGYINDYELHFKGVATIEFKRRSKVPITLWSISDRAEDVLDIYEGVRNKLYRKEMISVHLNTGEVVEAMVYILNGKKPDTLPSIYYFESIQIGYRENNLDIRYLLKAYEKSFKSENKRSILKYKDIKDRSSQVSKITDIKLYYEEANE